MAESLYTQVVNMLCGERGWEPIVRPGMFVPLQMRKKAADGKWIYRDPNEKEIQDYLQADAW